MIDPYYIASLAILDSTHFERLLSEWDSLTGNRLETDAEINMHGFARLAILDAINKALQRIGNT